MQITFNKKRSFLSGRYSVDFNLSTELKRVTAPLIFDGILREVLPLKNYRAETLQDLKGRDTPSEKPSPRAGVVEEVVSLKGELPLHKRGDERNQFEISVLTSFKAFQGLHHIDHDIKESRVGVLPDFVKTRNIARIFPLEITEFRLGLEQFTSQQFAFFGFTPEVTQALSISYAKDTLNLSLTGQKLRNLTEIPMSITGIFARLARVFKASLAIDLEQEYLQRCAS